LPSKQIVLPEAEIIKPGSPTDATKSVMQLIMENNESGGVTFDQILSVLKSQGYTTKRDYLHTILSRKKNYQKKIKKENKRWFLTDLGKEEMGVQ
jgi:Tfp pilus assembly ATPase PilU